MIPKVSFYLSDWAMFLFLYEEIWGKGKKSQSIGLSVFWEKKRCVDNLDREGMESSVLGGLEGKGHLWGLSLMMMKI